MTAVATVGGVLDVERFFLSALADETTVTLPLHVAYILLAYDDVYDIYARPADVFRQPYASTVPGLSDMEHFFDDVLAGLPPTSRELLGASASPRREQQPGPPAPPPSSQERGRPLAA